MNTLFEFLPLALFLGTYLVTKDLLLAMIPLMVAMPIALAVKYHRTGTFDRMMFWSTVLVLVFGGLTLLTGNKTFFIWKPTIFYWTLAAAFLGSQFIGDRPLVSRLFGLIDGLNLDAVTRPQWTRLNLVWVLFFVAVGLLNIYVAYNYEEQAWVTFKVFGLMGISVVFMILQTLWLMKLAGIEDDDEEGNA